MTRIDRFSYWKGTQIKLLQVSYLEEVVESIKVRKMQFMLSGEDTDFNHLDEWITALEEEIRHRNLTCYHHTAVKPLF